MKLARSLLFIVFGLQILAALIPFIPFFAHALPENPTPRTLLDFQITIFGFQFAIITGYLGVTLWLYERASDTRAKELIKAINAPTISRLPERAFYERFLAAAKSATERVDIMYLAQDAPDETRHKEKQDYYARLLRTIESMPRVRFRRIMRNSDSNRRWLSELLPKLAANCANADVGVLKEAGREEMPLSLSVQLVDSTQTWLVALETHEGSSKYRDIFIENAEFNSAMSGYYDRLWDRSDCLMKQGTLTPAGQNVIEEFRNGAQ
jgi:hypothetical protein